jgi:hypothetical protein
MQAPSAHSAAASTCARAELPPRLKILFFTSSGSDGRWLADAFAADGAAQIFLEVASDAAAGLTRLRDEVFDAILATHQPGALDALELAEAVRTGGNEEPLLILGHELPQDFDALAYEAGADEYCSIPDTTVRGLLWKLARAIQRFNLARENRRLIQAERQRLQHEHQEAERLLEQQRGLIEDLQQLSSDSLPLVGRAGEGVESPTIYALPSSFNSAESQPLNLPPALIDHYRELLRAYVIMGAGNLAHEMSTLAELLATANITAQQTMQLHVEVLEELIQGLGNRSARHVMNRADLLALEVMGHLADRYRLRAAQHADEPVQSEIRRGGGSIPGLGEAGPHRVDSLRDSLADFRNVLPRAAG